MCGFAGFVGSLPLPAGAAHTAWQMAERLAHRGPDDANHWAGEQCVLAFRRLSIIDLAGGRQPMANHDGTVQAVLNGEVYNFRELRRMLESKGRRFRTSSDTEVVVQAYEELGPSCVERFRGMFALALWDAKQRRLFLARDRVGKKPLYYFEADGAFVFASELKALLAHPACPRTVDREALAFYLTYGYIPAPSSALSGVRKLPPATTLEVDLAGGQRRERRYWDLRYEPKVDLSTHEACDALEEKLREAVRLRLISDVPLGVLLSGGVDSSLVAALAAGCSDRPVEAFTIGFEEPEYDERPWARMVARRYGMRHHELVVRPEATAVLPDLAYFLDEPMADASALPTWYVARLARSRVTVVLNGDGGDEGFGGYAHHASLQTVARFAGLPRPLLAGVAAPLLRGAARLVRGTTGRRLDRLAEQSLSPRWQRHLAKMQLFDQPSRDLLLGRAPGQPGPEATMEAVYGEAEGLGDVDAMLRADLLTVLPGQLLVKMDRMSMAHSLEARSPLLDQEVLALAATLPPRLKVRGQRRKILLRELAPRFLPGELVRRGKQGFAPPLAKWMGQDLGVFAREVLSDPAARVKTLLDPDAVTAEVEVDTGSAGCARRWALLILEFWLERVLAGSPPSAAGREKVWGG